MSSARPIRQHTPWSPTLFLLVMVAAFTPVRAQSSLAKGRPFVAAEADVPPYVPVDPLECGREKAVASLSVWEGAGCRQKTLQALERNVFGRTPRQHPALVATDLHEQSAFAGKATRTEVTLRLKGMKDGPAIHVLLYLPAASKGRVPVFVGLNFAGNQSVSDDPGITLGQVWIADPANRLLMHPQRAAEAMRGTAASEWPLAKIIDAGYGFATVYDGDLEPDFDGGAAVGFRGLAALSEAEVPADEHWGAVGVWAWGLSRTLDWLQTVPTVAGDRVAVIGHSRLGKAALWAGAQDTRFAAVISNESGKGGAALLRRDFGETVEHLNTRFAYWFDGQFHHYNDVPQSLPVDSSQLLALIAPRPLYVASAAGDTTLDARGEFLAAYTAGTVYALYGVHGLPGPAVPAIETPVGDRVRYHVRSGRHDMTAYDWSQYLAFADRFLK